MASTNACIRIEKKTVRLNARRTQKHCMNSRTVRHTYAFAVSQFIDICVQRSPEPAMLCRVKEKEEQE